MDTFGSQEIEWPDQAGRTHVIVATRASNWEHLCTASPDQYETVESVPGSTTNPVVWKHDPKRISCPRCLEMVAGVTLVTLERVDGST